MLHLSVLSFAIAAVLGVLMALRHFTRNGIPLSLALVHGFFAATGLVILVFSGLKMSFPAHTGLALVLFVGTALGGFTLFAMEFAKRALPSALVVAHGSAAVVSFLVLASSVFTV